MPLCELHGLLHWVLQQSPDLVGGATGSDYCSLLHIERLQEYKVLNKFAST